MLPNALTFGLFMFPVISFMVVLLTVNLIRHKFEHLEWPFLGKSH